MIFMYLGKYICIEVCGMNCYSTTKFEIFEIGTIIDMHFIDKRYFIFGNSSSTGAYYVSDEVYIRNFKLMSEYRDKRIEEIFE